MREVCTATPEECGTAAHLSRELWQNTRLARAHSLPHTSRSQSRLAASPAPRAVPGPAQTQAERAGMVYLQRQRPRERL